MTKSALIDVDDAVPVESKERDVHESEDQAASLARQLTARKAELGILTGRIQAEKRRLHVLETRSGNDDDHREMRRLQEEIARLETGLQQGIRSLESDLKQLDSVRKQLRKESASR